MDYIGIRGQILEEHYITVPSKKMEGWAQAQDMPLPLSISKLMFHNCTVALSTKMKVANKTILNIVRHLVSFLLLIQATSLYISCASLFEQILT